MVFFLCDACNETLKGKAVPGHLPRCGFPMLSCVDCSASFDSTTYRQHTSCITEDQKHKVQGSGNSKKKVDPQLIWTEQVARAAGACSTSNLKSLLERLTEFGNVPRKMKPFVNFCHNSIRVSSEAVLKQLFDAITAQALAKSGAKELSVAATTDTSAVAAATSAGRKRPRAVESEIDGDGAAVQSPTEDASPVNRDSAAASGAVPSFKMKKAILRLLGSNGGRLKVKRLRKFVVDEGVQLGSGKEDALSEEFESRMAKLQKKGLVSCDAKFVVLCGVMAEPAAEEAA